MNNQENFVLLDVLKGSGIAAKVESLRIQHPVFETEKNVSATLLTLNDITGDKLTAPAPTTVGIAYHKDRSMQIIKQLFDLGTLFDQVDKLEEARNSYRAFLAKENGYRNANYSEQETLQDTIDACYLICQSGLRGAVENDRTEIIRSGIRQIGTHLINTNYRTDDARLSASKTALMAALLKHNPSEPALYQLRFGDDRLDEIGGLSLTGKYQILNRLKAVSPAAFYYWHLIAKLERQGEL